MVFYADADWVKIEAQIMGATFTKKRKKGFAYAELPAAMDIETTSYNPDPETYAAWMYLWSMGFGDFIVYGRTWEEYRECIRKIERILKKCKDKKPKGIDKRIIIYVHNLSFEFQFMRNELEWDEVFATESRKVLFAVQNEHIEYRCSAMLSGYKLAKVGDNLRNPLPKLVGDLDYSLIRHSVTPLTENELRYAKRDIEIILQYIRECIEESKSINRLPLTVTGYVRKHMAQATVKNYTQFRGVMKNLTIEEDEMKMLNRAFMGGFTHANPNNAMKTLHNVRSFDLTSAYPSVEVLNYMPMSKGREVKVNTLEEAQQYLSSFCCLFDVEFSEIESTFLHEQYISVSKCRKPEGITSNNGRVVSAKKISMTLTEIDLEIILKTYKFTAISFGNFIVYKRGKLPKEIAGGILDLYEKKTTLKGQEDKLVEYMRSKGMVNSIYGMMVTAILRKDVKYSGGEWQESEGNHEKQLSEYNNKKGRFLFFPWGVWTTAHVRRQLWRFLIRAGADYVYSDTDSCKFLNGDKYLPLVEQFNGEIMRKIKRASEFYGIPLETFAPKNQKGERCPMGVWDDEGTYDRFKTNGAKRYLTEKNGKTQLTMAGVGKQNAVAYMKDIAEKNGKDVFDVFEDGLLIPKEHTGKMCHRYIDDPVCIVVTDYTGRHNLVEPRSGVHLAPIEFNMGIPDAYKLFVTTLQTRRVE